jgi:DNA-binding NarL/FixJ family response regulator
VLFLDDDEYTVRSLKRVLADEIEIIGATTAARAIEILRSDEHLDAAIFDIMGVAGYSVVEEARTYRGLDFPIAMLSGSREPEDINPAALAKPPIPFLAKGESTDDIRAWIRTVTRSETLDERRKRIVTEFCRDNDLTKRHRDVLLRRVQFKDSETIAEDLGIERSTVGRFECQIRERLSVDDLAPIRFVNFADARACATAAP